MDTLSKNLRTQPNNRIRWFTGAQFSIWITPLGHYLPRVAQKVKFNSFHPGQQENYIQLATQITMLIWAYSLLVLVQISKVDLHYENINKRYNHKKSRNAVNQITDMTL